MRICQIVPSLAERHGGPSKSVRALANHLADTGLEVELLATRAPGEEVPAGPDRAKVRVFDRVFPQRLCRAPALAAHVDDTLADCIHHHSLWLLTLRYAAASARRKGVPLVISPRGMMSGWAYAHRRGRKLLAEWLVHPGAFAHAAGWHATSTDEADDIRRLGFRQPICVAPNGVFPPTAPELAADRALWHQLCPALAGRRVALFYSRLHRKKRVKELIDLWLGAPRGDWLLLIVGTPEDYSPESLQAEIRIRQVTDRVAVLDGSGRRPPYAVASLFLLPSHSENFGLVIAEALAAGVPAVVTDTTPWSGLSVLEAGWCVPWTKYLAALAQALAMSEDELAARGERGRQWMSREYSWQRSAGLLQSFYARLRG